MALKRKVRLINEETQAEVQAPLGISWTTLFLSLCSTFPQRLEKFWNSAWCCSKTS